MEWFGGERLHARGEGSDGTSFPSLSSEFARTRATLSRSRAGQVLFLLTKPFHRPRLRAMSHVLSMMCQAWSASAIMSAQICNGCVAGSPGVGASVQGRHFNRTILPRARLRKMSVTASLNCAASARWSTSMRLFAMSPPLKSSSSFSLS